MWRRTPARWRKSGFKSLLSERWPVAVQLTSCPGLDDDDRLTGAAPDSRIGPGQQPGTGSPPVGASDVQVGPKKPSARRQVDVDVACLHKLGRYHNKTVFVGQHLN